MCLLIQMFVYLKMAPAEVESIWEKYGTFLNSFHPDFRRGREIIIDDEVSRMERRDQR